MILSLFLSQKAGLVFRLTASCNDERALFSTGNCRKLRAPDLQLLWNVNNVLTVVSKTTVLSVTPSVPEQFINISIADN